MNKYKCIKRYFGRIEVGEIVELQEDFEIKGIQMDDGDFHVLTFYWIHDDKSSNLIIYYNDLHEHFERVI